MFSRRRIALLTASACVLVLASAAAAAPNSFTATLSPQFVRPAITEAYTLTLANASTSDEANRAKVTIPPGFTVLEPVTATTTAAAACSASTWEADGPLVPGGRMNLTRPGGGGNQNLCPGGVLTISFSATSPTTPGEYTWTPELLSDETEAFTFTGDVTVNVDGDAPQTTIQSAPQTITKETSATFTFVSSEAGSSFECSIGALNDGAFALCTSPVTYTGLPAGNQTFRVRATDPAGNQDASPASRDWRIDVLGPATTILQAPPSSTNSTAASFLFESVEPGSTFECSLDETLFTPCDPPRAFSGLSDGPHTFAVRAVDQARNAGPAVTHAWTVDTRPPAAAVLAGPPGLTNSRSATFAFSSSEPSSFQCQLDAGGLVLCGSPVSYQGLADGTHTFVVRPTDAVGNPGAAASYTWTVDGTAPETTLGSRPRTGTTALTATFTFSASEAAGFECRLDGAAFQPCASPKGYSRLRRSAHRFEVRAVDRAGNPDLSPAVHRWTVGAASRKAAAASALLAPRTGAQVTQPPFLRWRAVPRASYYNVQLYRGRVKVLSSWPNRTRLQLRPRWTFLGRQRQLTPGTYRWYVWPGYGRPSTRRYGRLLGESTFTVRATAGR